MGRESLGLVGWFRRMDSRAEGYAQVRLSSEVHSLRDFRERKTLLFAVAFNSLKLYYVVSAPVVTIVARSDRLMSLARMLHHPSKQIIRKLFD